MPVEIGIDLGTSSIVVYLKNKGVVLKEPSVVAFDKKINKIIAIGDEARQMIGRAPSNIVIIKPLKNGAVSDFFMAERMLRYFINKALGTRSWRKPKVCISISSMTTDVERKAIEEAAVQAGAREVYVVDEPIASALGVGIDISQPVGNMIVDIGAATTEIAVISLDGIVVSSTLKLAGSALDIALMNYVRKKYSLLIGERASEEAKIEVGAVYPLEGVIRTELRGRDLMTGLPKNIELTSEDTVEAFREISEKIIAEIRSVLEKTPPELSADIAYRGLVITGGSCLLRGIDDLIEERTGITSIRAENPLTVVSIGTGMYMEKLK